MPQAQVSKAQSPPARAVDSTMSKCPYCEFLGRDGPDDHKAACLYSKDGVIHNCQKGTAKQALPMVETVEDAEPLDTPTSKPDIILPLDKIHPYFYSYWKQFEGRTETCKEYVLASLLVSMGAAIGNKAFVKIDRGIRPNMYLFLVGGSTFMRKITGMDYGTAILRTMSEAKKEVYEALMDAYDTAIQDWLDAPKHVRGEKPEKPSDKSNIYADELTPEMLLEKMAQKSDGCFLYSEAGSLLARLNNSYMAGFKERLTDFFDGRQVPYRRETKSGGRVTIRDAAPSLIGCSTFEWLKEHLSLNDMLSGFLARFLYVVRRSYPEQDIPFPPYFQVEVTWNNLFDALDKFDYALTPTAEAIASYSKWYGKFKAWAVKQDRLIHSFLGRLMTTCHKISLVNHALNYIQQGSAASKVRPESLDAIDYEQAYPWIEFFAKNILDCYEEITAGPDPKEQHILDIIGKMEGQRLAHYRLTQLSNMKSKELADYMITLQEKRYVRKVTKGKYVYWEIASKKEQLPKA
jgi:hypothetical protein